MAEPTGDPESKMIGCPVCGTELEPWQISCHGCGQSISSFEIPIIKPDDKVVETDLAKAYKNWMRRGTRAFKNGSYDEAHACFAEALKRVHGLEAHRANEIKARQKLSDAFLKLNKDKEAVEQLLRAADLATTNEQKATLQRRVDELNKKSGQVGQTSGSIKFRQPRAIEYMSAPLYCARCSRLMSEAEVYKFRSRKQSKSKCVCGFEGIPLTPEVQGDKKVVPVAAGPTLSRKKAQLIEAATDTVGGRDRKTAIWLAVLLGGLGMHKFYLGERIAGGVYLALCWTLIPWLVALYEAVYIAQMSRVNFNLVYNIESVIQRLPEDNPLDGEQSTFSMEVSEDPDGVVDEWSQEDETQSSGLTVPS